MHRAELDQQPCLKAGAEIFCFGVFFHLSDIPRSLLPPRRRAFSRGRKHGFSRNWKVYRLQSTGDPGITWLLSARILLEQSWESVWRTTTSLSPTHNLWVTHDSPNVPETRALPWKCAARADAAALFYRESAVLPRTPSVYIKRMCLYFSEEKGRAVVYGRAL